MKELTDHLERHAAKMDAAFRQGALDATPGAFRPHFPPEREQALWLWAQVREEWGLAPRAPLLTPPDANAKLAKGVVPSYGLTLQHHVQRINPKLVINACPNAGDCTKVCVLDNGNGGFQKVQLARRAKTAFLAEQPTAFSYLLGWELRRASEEQSILFRPNVNSDVAWERLLPSLTNGDVFLGAVTSYGYSKRPEVLDTDGWLGSHYRVAYSWSEKSDPQAVWEFLERGGSVAMVTSRRKGDFTQRQVHMPGADHLFINHYRHVDADLTDEWIFKEGVVGDLSAKGRARRLIGSSGFVVSVP